MKFGAVPVDEATGLILAHTVRAATVLKKGHVVTPADVAMLKSGGFTHVVGARLGAGDVGEDEAAAQIAGRLAGPHIQVSPARTGRCNLLAATNGVLIVDKAAIDAANGVDESVTIATLPEFAAAKERQIIATVKIIPFAVAAETLVRATAALGSCPARFAPFRPKQVAVISTLLPGLKASIIASTEDVVRARVSDIDGTVLSVTRIPHDDAAVAHEIRSARDAGADLILIVGASATSDRSDVIPLGIKAAGGDVDHFGMPVDPGNLLVLGRVGQVSVVVLPGCARSPKLNGADWVLQRLAADISVTSRDIMSLGVGGLLVDTPRRPLPRDQAVSEPQAVPTPKIAAVVLAGGQSRRMGGRNKLTMEVEGVPLVRRTVATVMDGPVAEVIVVTGHEPEKVEDALRGLNVRVVHNPRFADGLSTSLKAGIAALSSDVSGAVICLGDMPGIATSHIARLVAKFDPDQGREIGLPTHQGKRGNPVLWGRRFFPEMLDISGDVGARHLIGANESVVYEVEFEDAGVLVDLDTPGQWEDFLASSSPPRDR